MRLRATACLAAVLTVVLGGCGTVVNCVNGKGHAARDIYGGVKQDAQNGARHLGEAFSGPAPCLSKIPQPPSATRDFVAKTFCAGCGVGMLAVDLPVSAVADTLTLPLTVPATLMKKKPNAKQKAKPSRTSKSGSAVPAKPPKPSAAQVGPAIPNW
ncbi:MAG TPA: YceK/YidQ family lipoprotein [Gemmataceae bacterium]|nr:YceK/YidQ family lipoprotein [Gemmataceae bacterium]